MRFHREKYSKAAGDASDHLVIANARAPTSHHHIRAPPPPPPPATPTTANPANIVTPKTVLMSHFPSQRYLICIQNSDKAIMAATRQIYEGFM